MRSIRKNSEVAADGERHFERALWRSRRGMLELDILLVGFARCRYRALGPADQRAYQELLRLDDWTIVDWLQRDPAHSGAPVHLARILRLIAREQRSG